MILGIMLLHSLVAPTAGVNNELRNVRLNAEEYAECYIAEIEWQQEKLDEMIAQITMQKDERDRTRTSLLDSRKSLYSEMETVGEENSQRLLISPYNGYLNVDEQRRAIVGVASSLKGKVTYLWGGKSHDGEGNWEFSDQMDCSGFVEWVYHRALNMNIGTGTFYQSQNGVMISKDDLMPGDLGFLYYGPDAVSVQSSDIETPTVAESTVDVDETTILVSEAEAMQTETEYSSTARINHVGIYYGKNADGVDMWIHCNATDNTVSVAAFEGFTYFVRFIDVENIASDDGEPVSEENDWSYNEDLTESTNDFNEDAL